MSRNSVDFLQLTHKIFFIVKTTGRIGNNHSATICTRTFCCIKNNCARVASMLMRNHSDSKTLTVHFELFLSRSPESVTCRHNNFFALFFVKFCNFGSRCSFSDTVYSKHHKKIDLARLRNQIIRFNIRQEHIF